jgi:hypothetical protein
MPVHPDAAEYLATLYPGDKMLMENLNKFIKRDEEKLKNTYK